MLIFFVFVKLLSLMTNTRERFPHRSGRKTYRCGHPRFCERPHKRIRDIYREYAGSGGVMFLTGEKFPCLFAVIYVIVNYTIQTKRNHVIEWRCSDVSIFNQGYKCG